MFLRRRSTHPRHSRKCFGAAIATLNPQKRVSVKEMADTFETGVKYALAVGAASAAVGIVIGVINTTGVDVLTIG